MAASHAKALHPNVMLVSGMRGAGKSFWWSALQMADHRAFVQRSILQPGFERAEVEVGFGENPNPDAYPSAEILASLLKQGIEPRTIWKTVILSRLAPSNHALRTRKNWLERVGYLRQHSDEMQRLLDSRDREFDKQGRYWIILFDALDRTASDWPTVNGLIRGLLQAVLELGPYRRLRAKCFLRSDQLKEREVATLPGASKIFSNQVELKWPNRELFNLLWQYLGNATGTVGKKFRKEARRVPGVAWNEAVIGRSSIWLPGDKLTKDEELQKLTFHSITGPWMGRDRQRDLPYAWIPAHLADAAGMTSPRSFLAALRAAAKESHDRYSSHAWPLHYESIKHGVQAASTIRVRELREDYPWVDIAVRALSGKVPFTSREVSDSWVAKNVVGRIKSSSKTKQRRLPPPNLGNGLAGLRKDLETLGVFLPMQDGRINIPDVFRVGYGLGRKGGVRPVRAERE